MSGVREMGALHEIAVDIKLNISMGNQASPFLNIMKGIHSRVRNRKMTPE